MNDYYSVKIKFLPYNEDLADLMAGFLSDIGYESFVKESDVLIAYIPAADFSENSLQDVIEEFPGGASIEVNSEFVEGRDWNSEWEKNYFKPITIGDKVVIHATFHDKYPEAEYEIIIDPRMAFGTGHHATTSMMISHLLDMDLKGKDIIDMGTGTGILAIFAKMRGARHVTGIEIDPAAYENALDNTALNNVSVEIIRGDAESLSDCGIGDVFLANINRNIILADLPRYIEHIKPNGVLILSGFYETDVPLLERALSNFGMKFVKKSVDGEWCSLVVTFKSTPK